MCCGGKVAAARNRLYVDRGQFRALVPVCSKGYERLSALVLLQEATYLYSKGPHCHVMAAMFTFRP